MELTPHIPDLDPHCEACRIIDSSDGTEDGHIGVQRPFRITDERALMRHLRHAESSAADGITNFAGSMKFVYIHAIWFGVWIALNVGAIGMSHRFDKFPFGLLTMIVSLEAIFLATFVMISQNRQAIRSDVRSKLDFENNVRSEVWSVHIGLALGIDIEHVETLVQKAIMGIEEQLRESSAP
ncbi:MAG TPA: DUF1003 domain-containing protein [Ilumatobacteraceae bacterium]